MKLLKKEFRLCLHPTAPLFLMLSTMVLIPNYPYAVCFFYMTLAVFFICLTSRENHDAAYNAVLPVSRAQIVRGRILFVCCFEVMNVVACGLMLLAKNAIGWAPNQAGLDANIAVLGEGLIVFGLFNGIFFPMWYKNINQVGVPFLVSAAAVFLYIGGASASTYIVPFVRDCLDTPDPEFWLEKLLFTGAALIFFILLTALGMRLSIRRFERFDLQL